MSSGQLDRQLGENDALAGATDGSEFLHHLRSSVSETHYNGTSHHYLSPQTAGERLASNRMASHRANIGVGDDASSAMGTPKAKNNDKKQVSLQDILQAEPVESQTDTALIQSLEEEDYDTNERPPHHRPVATGTSTILTNVPLHDDMAHAFEIDDIPPMLDPQDDEGREADHLTSTRPLLQRTSTRRSMRNTNNLHHHRGQSVEQTLFDLTLALKDMHGSHHRASQTHHRHVTSTAEEFAQNALRLHQTQQQPHDDEATRDATSTNTSPSAADGEPSVNPASPSPGGRLWDVLLEGLPTPREQQQQQQERQDSGDTGVASLSTEVADVEQGTSTITNNIGNEKPPPVQPKKKPQASSNVINNKVTQKKKKRNSKSSHHRHTMHKKHHWGTVDKFKEDWQAWNEFFRPRRKHLTTYVKTLVFYLILPAVGVAAMLYYLLDNPPTGTLEDGQRPTETGKASASYILLFCCRQLVTFSLAFATQIFLVDFIALNTRVMLNILGPVLTLLVVQSKGWPFLLLWWSIYDFALLAGDYPFVHHWLYFQSTFGLFSDTNPSGQLVNNEWYWRVLTITTSVSIVVAVKRFLLGLYLGRATFSNYGELLAKAIGKMLMVGEVAAFAQDIEHIAAARGQGITERIIADNAIHGLSIARSEDETETVLSGSRRIENSTRGMDPLTDKLHYSERMRLMQLLEQWEEPMRQQNGSRNEVASISAVLRFREALTFIQKQFPFGKEFGLADTRNACIESAQEVYRRLMKATPGEESLSFETIAFLALEDDGIINEAKVKSLIKLFRPDRQGNLSLLDFCKSIDAVYKEFRFLDATIQNSSQIDRAFEHIVNAIFYIIVTCIVLSQLGFDPLALFLSLSSVILAFAFMIGSASAKYFEGILFILIRRPYGIGDRVQVGNIETDASLHGVLPWVVENVTLFETTLVYLPTNERASLSNGSLANSRIINWARSPQAQFHIFLQFPLNTPYQKLVLFKKAVEEYMRARPREWRALNGFRCNMVYAKENYMEYLIVIQHREAWQEVGQVLDSKANLTSYCQEIARQLEMEYKAPQVPVHLIQEPVTSDKSMTAVDEMQFDENELTNKFADIAHKKHGIRVC